MDLAFVPSANTFTSAAFALLLRILCPNRVYRGVSEIFININLAYSNVSLFPNSPLPNVHYQALGGWEGLGRSCCHLQSSSNCSCVHRGDPLDPDRLCQCPSATGWECCEGRESSGWAQRDWSRGAKRFAIIPHLPPDPWSLEGMCLSLSLGDAGINGIADQSISTGLGQGASGHY